MTSLNYFDSNMFNSTNTIVHIAERRKCMLTDAGKVTSNLCDAVRHSIFHIVKFTKVFTLKLD
jgi:hypothetical protein